MADRRTFNVVVLGLGFLFIFTAFTTCGNIEVSLVSVIPPISSKQISCGVLSPLESVSRLQKSQFCALNSFLNSHASILLSSSCLRRLMMNQYSPTFHAFVLFIQ